MPPFQVIAAVLAGGAVFLYATTSASLWSEKRRVRDAFVRLVGVLRMRTESVTELLKSVKTPLKGTPAYDDTLEAMKATLETEGMTIAELARRESILGEKLLTLVAAIRADDTLKSADAVRKAFAPLPVLDDQIHKLARETTTASAALAARTSRGVARIVADLSGIKADERFDYTAPPLT